jgi:hypothetical protein
MYPEVLSMNEPAQAALQQGYQRKQVVLKTAQRRATD